MKKILVSVLASLALSACGSNDDDTPARAPEQQNSEPAPVKPAPLKIDPALKPKFVEECKFALAAEGAPVKPFYANILMRNSTTDCASAYDVIASKRSLALGTGNINSLLPLAFFPFIERLEIIGPLVNETAELAKLKNLQSLTIQMSDVTDLSFLTAVPYLSTLVIESTPFTSLAPLVKLPNLRNLAFEAPKDKSGKETLAKDEAHCPVLSERKAVNDVCKDYRGIK